MIIHTCLSIEGAIRNAKDLAVCQIAQAICEEKEACERYCGICTDCKAYQEAKKIYEERKG